MVVPGVAKSGETAVLEPLVEAIRRRIPTSVAPVVTIGPTTPWSLDLDIPGYAKELHAFIQGTLRRYPGCRLALVGFSLGGTLILYYLATLGTEIGSPTQRPLVITLASPVNGSVRYRRALAKCQGSSLGPVSVGVAALVAQVQPGSAVMRAVQRSLVREDVHLLVSSTDQVVDGSAGCPRGHMRVKEIDVHAASPVQRHFGFPQHPAVIDEVIDLIRGHLGLSAAVLGVEKSA